MNATTTTGTATNATAKQDAPKPAVKTHMGCQACGDDVPCRHTHLGWLCDDCIEENA